MEMLANPKVFAMEIHSVVCYQIFSMKVSAIHSAKKAMDEKHIHDSNS